MEEEPTATTNKESTATATPAEHSERTEDAAAAKPGSTEPVAEDPAP